MIGLMLSMPVDPTLKCPGTQRLPGFAEDQIAVVVDGEIRKHTSGGGPLEDLQPANVHRLDVTCWNPDTGEIPATAGVPVIVVVTRSALAEAESAMRRATRSVRSYIAVRAELPSSIEVLDPRLVGYSIGSRAGPWTLTSPAQYGHVCTATQRDIAEDTTGCRDIFSPVAQVLREAWERR